MTNISREILSDKTDLKELVWWINKIHFYGVTAYLRAKMRDRALPLGHIVRGTKISHEPSAPKTLSGMLRIIDFEGSIDTDKG